MMTVSVGAGATIGISRKRKRRKVLTGCGFYVSGLFTQARLSLKYALVTASSEESTGMVRY
jgi:hypothetical protein